MTTHATPASTVQRTVRRAARAARNPGDTLRALNTRRGDRRPPSESVVELTPAEAVRENGFAVFRRLVPPAECAGLAARLKSEAGIDEGVKFMKVDATNSFPTAREILLAGPILAAVRAAIGPDARFLQVSDLHYLHDTQGWHRDSVHRAKDASAAPDWRDPANPFKVVKAIVYLESENAAMGIMPGSHNSPIAMDGPHAKQVEERGAQLVVDRGVEPNRRFTPEQRRDPIAWRAEVGDVLVFDERMYHAGRRVDVGAVSANRAAPKFTLSLVFGADNHHSERMYSYFRYARRELNYRDLNPDFAAELAARGLVLSQGWSNFYEREPQELRHVHLPNPAVLDGLIADFSR